MTDSNNLSNAQIIKATLGRYGFKRSDYRVRMAAQPQQAVTVMASSPRPVQALKTAERVLKGFASTMLCDSGPEPYLLVWF